MSRVIENEDLYETWKNESAGVIVIKRIDRAGKVIDEIIYGGKTFHLTPNERKMNQELVVEESYDFFKNGTLIPVKLIESIDDYKEIASNPNHLSQDDMKVILKSRSLKAFQDKLDTISNPVALSRLLEIAEEEDATIKQITAIKNRLQDVAPSLYSEVETVEAPQTGLRSK